MKIILVDPDGMVREELRQTLEDKAGHRVMCCSDIEAVWKLLGNPAIRCEAVVLELAQPGGTGRSIAFLERLRADAARKQMQVVVYTGTVDRVIKDRAQQLGARHFLTKPISPDALVGAINQIDGEIADIEPIEDLADAAKRRGTTPDVLSREIASFLSRAEAWVRGTRAAVGTTERSTCALDARKLGEEGAAVGLREVARQLRGVAATFDAGEYSLASLTSRLQAIYGELGQTRSILDLG